MISNIEIDVTGKMKLIYLQLSKIVWHRCSSKGNFCKFIQQLRVAWIRVDIITVPSGDTDTNTSFSDVPRIDDALSFAKNICGVHRESRSEFSPMMGSLRLGATSRKTNRGSTYRNCNKACILNCYQGEKNIRSQHILNRININSEQSYTHEVMCLQILHEVNV